MVPIETVINENEENENGGLRGLEERVVWGWFHIAIFGELTETEKRSWQYVTILTSTCSDLKA